MIFTSIWAKARGFGLAAPLDRVEFTVDGVASPRVRFAPGMPDQADRWRFALHRPGPGHVLAVAAAVRSPETFRAPAGPLPQGGIGWGQDCLRTCAWLIQSPAMQTIHALGAALITLGSASVTLLPRGCELPDPDPGHQKNPVSWQTPNVTLTADDFWIEVEGEKFEARVAGIEVSGDPGWNAYTSLELVWFERGREMRLFIYFKSDGMQWWSDEIRTYDGQVPAEWIYYFGDHFRTPVGQPFRGAFDVTNNGPEDHFQGAVHFENLRLSVAFSRRSPP